MTVVKTAGVSNQTFISICILLTFIKPSEKLDMESMEIDTQYPLPSKEAIKQYMCSYCAKHSLEYTDDWNIVDTDEEIGLAMIGKERQQGPAPIEDSNDCCSLFRGTCWTAEPDGTVIMAVPNPLNSKPIVGDQICAKHDPVHGITLSISDSSKDSNPVSLFTDNQRYKISHCVEGFLIKYACVRGKYLKLTNTKIDGRRSKWGSVPMLETAERIGLKDYAPEQLYQKEENRSLVFAFMATNADTITSTRQYFLGGHGYVTFLGCMNSKLQGLEKQTLYNPENVSFKCLNYENFPAKVNEYMPVIEQVSLSLEEVNRHLRDGFMEQSKKLEDNYDWRQLPSESVIIHLENGPLSYKVVPRSFHWRNWMRGGDSSIRNRFYVLISQPRYFSVEEYMKEYIYFDLDYRSSKEIFKNIKQNSGYALTFKPHVPAVEFSKFNDQIVCQNPPLEEVLKSQVTTNNAVHLQIFLNFFLCIPLNYQPLYADLYEEYVALRNRYINFVSLYTKKKVVFLKSTDSLQSLVTVGSVSSPPTSVPAGKIYHRGPNSIIYDITEIVKNYRMEKGKALFLGNNINRKSLNFIQNLRKIRQNTSWKNFIQDLLDAETAPANLNYSPKYQILREMHGFVEPKDLIAMKENIC